ncbi:hypothetical protein F5Y10DRAFT_143492 [Nemania abortiva]|nr:hypothetical protein F5Y10DRAFT_143492 [Nemania abortiva]
MSLNRYYRDQPLYSPRVAIPQRQGVRESQLDPAYGSSSGAATMARRRRRENRIQTVWFVVLGLVLCYLMIAALEIFDPKAVQDAYQRVSAPREARVSYGNEPERPEEPEEPEESEESELQVIRSFWRDYADLMSANEHYEDWFVDVDEATEALEIMNSAVQPPETKLPLHEEISYNARKNLTMARSQRLEKIRWEWKGFTRTRERLIAEIVRSAASGYVSANGQVINDTRTGEIGKYWAAVMRRLFESSSLPSPNAILSTDLKIIANWTIEGPWATMTHPVDNHSYDALTLAARAILEDAAITHAWLFRAWDIKGNVAAALGHERTALQPLLKHSLRNNVWEQRQHNALPALTNRLIRLEKLYYDVESSLVRLRDKFSSEPHTPEGPDAMARYENMAKELLKGWATALLDIEEGVLFMLRRRSIGTWEDWKSRNCGGTSCYNAQPVISILENLKTVFGQPKPDDSAVAEVAQDEADWDRSLGGDGIPRVWRNIYEVACCQPLSTLSFHLKSDRDQGLRSDPKSGR